MTQDFSIVHLLLNASWVVQVVVLMLMGVSITSWAAIFRKIGSIKRVNELNDEFERDFWSGTSLNELFAAAAQNAKTSGPMERIFASGMREYQKLRERRINDSSALMDGARRAMRASYQREMDAIESNLSLLASVGSVSPYVGLFGTVWGIMNTFTSIGANRDTSLATVAPGIAEALIATGIGLAAAIPAIMAYNKLSTDMGRYSGRVGTVVGVYAGRLAKRFAPASKS